MIGQIWWGAKQNKSAIATESACGTCTWVNFKQEMFSEPIFFYIDFPWQVHMKGAECKY